MSTKVQAMGTVNSGTSAIMHMNYIVFSGHAHRVSPYICFWDDIIRVSLHVQRMNQGGGTADTDKFLAHACEASTEAWI
jgi:hypothetical protein